MASIVAGSTYLVAPPPKAYGHNHLIASLLCHPIAHPHLLLQLQRKDPDTRRAFPQFDLVCRRSGRLFRKDADRSSGTLAVHNGRRPRKLSIQQSETGERIASVKYVNTLSSAQKRRMGIAPDDESVLAVVDWNFSKSVIQEWTVHRYESSKKNARSVGYEFRLRGSNQRTKGFVCVRWTRKIAILPSPSPMKERPRSMSSRTRRSNSVTSIEGPTRRHTFAATPTTQTPPPEAKWEFSLPSSRRTMATMTAQKLHIHSLASNTTPLSSPSNSDFDEEIQNDRELTSGRKLEFLVVSGLLVGLEEDFASQLRNEFLTVGGGRITPPLESEIISDIPIIKSPRKKRNINRPDTVAALSIVEEPSSTTTVTQQQTVQRSSQESSDLHDTKSQPRTVVSTSHTPVLSSGYILRGWGLMTSAASVCATKIMSLAA
jgi:hypothetical protein